MKQKSRIRKIDTDIFSTLYRARRPLPIKKIAERIEVSWPTANTYVKRLQKINAVIVKKSVRMSRVELNPLFLKKWKKQLSV